MSSELIFGLFCLVFVVGTFWLSAVFEGRRRDREQKTQQVVEEASDPRAVWCGCWRRCGYKPRGLSKCSYV